MPDLGMHWAGVDRAFGHRLWRHRHRRCCFLAKIMLRVGDEFRPAARRAEIIGLPLILGAVLGGIRINSYAADHVLYEMRLAGLGFDRHRPQRSCLFPKITLWVGEEFRPAVGAAEIIGLPPILGAVRVRLRINRHSANRVVFDHFGLSRWRAIVVTVRRDLGHITISGLTCTPYGYILRL